MNIAKLFETQKVLRDRIGYTGSDRFEKLILALIVEVGECANEWRGFKFWSKNQQPKTKIEHLCPDCGGSGDESYHANQKLVNEGQAPIHLFEPCTECDATGKLGESNPLLEEYVDGLHFLLEIGLELNYTNMLQATIEDIAVESQFNDVFNDICYLRNICDLRLANQSDWEEDEKQEAFEYLWADFFGLGKMLGFTWKQIEQAYYDKNQVNHVRQDTGY